MRTSIIAVGALAFLASAAQAVPLPTAQSGAASRAEHDDHAHAWLGNELDPVSLEPIPTPMAEVFDDDFMDLLSLQPGGAAVETDREFNWCANEGKGNPSCFCNGAMRYGSYGTDETRAKNRDVQKWAYRRACGNVDCDAKDFGGVDPFPGEQKICQCTAPIPTPTPAPNSLPWKFCSSENKTCECGANSIVRFGSTGSKDLYGGGSQPTFFVDHPEVTKFKYHETPLTKNATYNCVNASFPGPDPWPEGTREKDQLMICQCAPLPPKSEELCEATPTPEPTFSAKEAVKSHKDGTVHGGFPVIGSDGEPVPDSAPRPWEVKWTWCANQGDACNCLGVARYGHSGEFEMYADNSKFFRENPQVFKWVNKQTTGAITCNSDTFGGLDPFPDHKKMCHCASGVGIDVFTPFSVGADDEPADPVASIPVTPQVVLSNPSASLGSMNKKSAPRHAYHHKIQPADHHFEARDLAGFSKAELDLLHRSDEVAAMKAATAAIAAREGKLPTLPEEGGALGAARSSILGKFANLGAAAPAGKSGVYLFGVGVFASAVAVGVLAAKKKTRASSMEEAPLNGNRYDVYL